MQSRIFELCFKLDGAYLWEAIIKTTEAGRDIGLRIAVIARMMRGNFDRQVARLNITRSRWSLISVVRHRPGSTQREIADVLEMSEASAGRLIDRLCTEGLLERHARDDDRRARAIYLSENAEPLLVDMAAAARVLEDQMFQGFSEDDFERLGDFMDRMYGNLCKP